MSVNEETPFAELPAALIDEVLRLSEDLGESLLGVFDGRRDSRAERRQQLQDNNLLRNDRDLPPVSMPPTTCGIDGSYSVERLLAFDFVAAAAIAVEGLTPPFEKRHWDDTHHTVYLRTEPHHERTKAIVQTLMVGMEICLAEKAPHDVVFLDGSLLSPYIDFFHADAALQRSRNLQQLQSAQTLLDSMDGYLLAYRNILASRRTDKFYVSVPKYTTRFEIGSILGWAMQQNDRSVLTATLERGEYTMPVKHGNVGRVENLDRLSPLMNRNMQVVQSILEEISQISVLYYRPHRHLPALLLEMSQSIANNPHHLAMVLEAVRFQCGTTAIMEPYPLYLADRLVKSLSRGMVAIRQVATERLATKYDGPVEDIVLAMHSYRTESGFSG